jgi:hypothetical protein
MLPVRTALLQSVYVLECVADRDWMPSASCRRCRSSSPSIPSWPNASDSNPATLRCARPRAATIEVARYRKFLGKLVPPMLERAETHAARAGKPASSEAVALATSTLDAELSRLLALRAVNPSISEAEIAHRQRAIRPADSTAAVAPATGCRALRGQPGFPRAALIRAVWGQPASGDGNQRQFSATATASA